MQYVILSYSMTSFEPSLILAVFGWLRQKFNRENMWNDSTIPWNDHGLPPPKKGASTAFFHLHESLGVSYSRGTIYSPVVHHLDRDLKTIYPVVVTNIAIEHGHLQ